MLLDEQARGVYIISATPFDDDGALDLASTDRLVDFYLASGVAGITILGMMGEAQKLDAAESLAFMRRVLARVDGRLPVVVGVSSPSHDNLQRLAHSAMDCGAAGVMVAPMAGLATDERLLGYFGAVCERLGGEVPLVYQDYPQATGVHISTAAFNTLVDRHAQIVMLKHEDCPALAKLSAVRETALRDGRRRVSILCGNGGLYLPLELARGADGAMTGFAWPEMLVAVCEGFAAGDTERAEDLFDAYLPLVRYEQQPGFGLAIRKEVLRRRGAIATARTRAPGPSMSAADLAELDRLVERLRRRLGELGEALPD